jgi:O-antigen biosynthesis protein
MRLFSQRFWSLFVRFLILIWDLKFKEAWVKILNKVHARFFIQPEYVKWLKRQEPKPTDLIQQRKAAVKFPYQPLISIIMPVYNTAPGILKDTINSVLQQTFPHWELCISEGHSDHSEIRSLISEYLEQDKRIKAVFLNENLMISGNSNEALALASGEFIALLDHDDVLAPQSLYRVIELLNKDPHLDFIYSDQDLVSTDGIHRFNPIFKPDWSPELLISANYISHFAVIRKKLIDRAGPFDPSTDGAQDWDLFFRVSELTEKIGHLPEVLYHWRQSLSSVSLNPDTKPYAVTAQIRAIDNHLKRNNISANPRRGPSGYFGLHWDQPQLISPLRIIIAWDPEPGLRNLVETLSKIDSNRNLIKMTVLAPPAKTITEKEATAFRKNQVAVLRDESRWTVTRIKNRAVELATEGILLFLNSSLNVVNEEALEEMVGWISQTNIGLVSGQVLAANHRLWDSGILFNADGTALPAFRGTYSGEFGIFGSTEWYRNYNAVAGNCMMIRRDLFNRLGGFNETLTDEESPMEFCLRLRQNGHRILVTPYAQFKLSGTVDFNQKLTNLSASTLDLWKSLSPNGDSYFNRNLSFQSPALRFKTPGE